jgi:hypothetical protein
MKRPMIVTKFEWYEKESGTSIGRSRTTDRHTDRHRCVGCSTGGDVRTAWFKSQYEGTTMQRDPTTTKAKRNDSLISGSKSHQHSCEVLCQLDLAL